MLSKQNLDATIRSYSFKNLFIFYCYYNYHFINFYEKYGLNVMFDC